MGVGGLPERLSGLPGVVTCTVASDTVTLTASQGTDLRLLRARAQVACAEAGDARPVVVVVMAPLPAPPARAARRAAALRRLDRPGAVAAASAVALALIAALPADAPVGRAARPPSVREVALAPTLSVQPATATGEASGAAPAGSALAAGRRARQVPAPSVTGDAQTGVDPLQPLLVERAATPPLPSDGVDAPQAVVASAGATAPVPVPRPATGPPAATAGPGPKASSGGAVAAGAPPTALPAGPAAAGGPAPPPATVPVTAPPVTVPATAPPPAPAGEAVALTSTPPATDVPAPPPAAATTAEGSPPGAARAPATVTEVRPDTRWHNAGRSRWASAWAAWARATIARDLLQAQQAATEAAAPPVDPIRAPAPAKKARPDARKTEAAPPTAAPRRSSRPAATAPANGGGGPPATAAARPAAADDTEPSTTPPDSARAEARGDEPKAGGARSAGKGALKGAGGSPPVEAKGGAGPARGDDPPAARETQPNAGDRRPAGPPPSSGRT